MKLGTLCFLIKDEYILLAMKKRGFGLGKWNGVGGKVNPDEKIEAAALRELEEEIMVIGEEKDLESMGMLKFRSENKELNWDCHIFFLRRWQGEPQESEEMQPKWHLGDQLPFNAMWPDDRYWFPYVLSGKKIEGRFELNSEGKEVVKFEIKEI